MRTAVTSKLLLTTILVSTLLFNGPSVSAQDRASTSEPDLVDIETNSLEEPAAETASTSPTEEAEPAGDGGFQDQVNEAFGKVNGFLAAGMFYPVGGVIPLAVLWLVMGSIFFTVRMGFINIRAFKHAILVTAGRYDNPEDAGEVSHFQALTSALSATVGLGNIAGVAIAIALGGPGATFWMIAAGFLPSEEQASERRVRGE